MKTLKFSLFFIIVLGLSFSAEFYAEKVGGSKKTVEKEKESLKLGVNTRRDLINTSIKKDISKVIKNNYTKDLSLNKNNSNLPVSSDMLNILYQGEDPINAAAFGDKLHQVVNSKYINAFSSETEYSHYLIDRLVFESDTELTYVERNKKIQTLIDANEYEELKGDEINFLIRALATLPLNVKSPQWRSIWHSRLLEWSEYGLSDVSNSENNEWLIKVNDYQRVSEKLAEEMSDRPQVFKLAQDDLRNSYFTDDEIVKMMITDNTINLLNKLNQ